MHQEYAGTRNPVIVWQNADGRMQMMILGCDPAQNRKEILALLSVPDDRWDRGTWMRAWAVIEDTLRQEILAAEDLQALLRCPNDSVSLALWDNADFLLGNRLLKIQNFEQNREHLVAILSAFDDTWDLSRGETVMYLLEHLVESDILKGPDLLCLLACANDPVCFAAWKETEYFLKAGFLKTEDVARCKDRFMGLIVSHWREWEGIHAWGDEYGVWSVIATLHERNILTHRDFQGLLTGENDGVCLALLKNARFLLRKELLDISDLRQARPRLQGLLAKMIDGPPQVTKEQSGDNRKIRGEDLIGDLVEIGFLTCEDKALVQRLLTHENRDFCLAAWENAYQLIRQGILTREDFVLNADHFREHFLTAGFPEGYLPNRDKKIFKFLVETGVCTLATLNLIEETGDVFLHICAFDAVQEITCERKIDAAIRMLSDDSLEVRMGAARELEANRGEYAVGLLIPLLTSENIRTRYHAAQLLRTIRSPGALFPLVRALMEENACVRFQVSYALRENAFNFSADIGLVAPEQGDLAFAEIATEPAVDALMVRVLRQDDAWFRETAVRVIEKTGTFTTVDALIRALDRDDAIAVKNAASACIAIAPAEAVEALIRALNDPDAGARETAVRALKRFPGEQACDAFIQAISDPDATVRSYAARALGRCGFEPAVRALMLALWDEATVVRRSAARSLGKIHAGPAADLLIRALNDPDIMVRYFAAVALGEIRSADALDPLTRAAKEENLVVQIAAKDALKLIGLAAVPCERR